MMLDSSLSSSDATGASLTASQGTPDFGSGNAPVSKVEAFFSDESGLPWCYVFTHHMKVPVVEQAVKNDGQYGCFVHRTIKYLKKADSHGVKTIERPTVCGLVFLRGEARDVQTYLNQRFPGLHLVNDRATGRPAVISAREMSRFIRASQVRPDAVELLSDRIERFAALHTLIRITSGPLSGLEGYIVRIRRDRKLIINLGGLAVAVGGIHGEMVEEVKESN